MSKVSVYLNNGLVFDYDVNDPMKGRDQMEAIIKSGYRSTPKDSDDLTWWPPHKIEKVVVEGAGESTTYKDKARAT